MKASGLAFLLTGSAPVYAQLNFIQPSNSSGSSMAVVVDNVALTHTAQIFPLDKRGALVGKNDMAAQITQVVKNAKLLLKATHSGLDKVVKMNIYTSNENFIPEIKKQFASIFSGKTKPAVTYIVNKLPNGADVAIDLIAASGSGEKKVQYYNTAANYGAANTKAAVMPAGGVTYISGQADKGDLLHGVQGTLRQLDASLKFLGIQKQDVVQLKAFMNNTGDIPIVEKEFAAYFQPQAIPPVVYVEWISKEYEIEIELIAASPKVNEGRDTSISFLDLPGMVHSPVYSKATQINYGKKIYFSELYGNAPNNSNVQTTELFLNLKNLLVATGCDFTHLAKATYFHTDAASSAALNIIRPKYYDPHHAPAATKAMLKAMPDGKSVGLDMIGAVK